MHLIANETSSSLSPEEERARKRQAIGLTARRPTAPHTIHFPPEENFGEGRGLMWMAVLFLMAMSVATAWMIYDAVWDVPGVSDARGLRLDDDFAPPHLALPTSTAEGTAISFVDGAYQIALQKPGQLVWSTLGLLDLETYRLESALFLDAGKPLDEWGYAGLLVRYANGQNFYLFTVDGRGAYQVQLQKDAVWRTLQPWTRSAQIHTNAQSNLLAVEDDGNRIRFYANDSLLFSVDDPRLSGGDVGFAAGTRSQGNVIARFDWVKIHDVPLGTP